MEVKDIKRFDEYPEYSIEWGNATWTEGKPEHEKTRSIRNRYNKEDGGYNHVGSKEIPWGDFNLMILESIKREHFSKQELSEILVTIANHLKK